MHHLKVIFILLFTVWLSACNNQANEHKTDTPAVKQTTTKVGGTYSFGEYPEKGAVGSLIVYPLTDSSALFYLNVCKGAPSYNQGQLLGKMIIKEHLGIYDSKVYDDDLNCILTFKFSSNQVELITENGHDLCGFGGNVYADYKYQLIDSAIPSYFINLEGDTISFEGLTIEKYKHRFE